MPDKTIVLICNGCLNVWLDPKDKKWEGVVHSKKALEDQFSMDLLSLLEDERGYWSTRAEVNNSKWEDLLASNSLFLIKYNR